jgi:ubiquinone/menaquinone biosynthesis C-methylase UbiE
MNHDDRRALIREGIGGSGGTWAELGSGAGAFTLALAELLGSRGKVMSVDRDAEALEAQARAVETLVSAAHVQLLRADFSFPLDLPPLDGVLMANSLHFIEDAGSMLRWVIERLAPGGRIIVVEYNIVRPNQWVPHPLPYDRWAKVALKAGLSAPRLLATRPSRYHREVYSALSVRAP